MTTKICVIDTGFSKESVLNEKIKIEGVTIQTDGYIEHKFDDEIGHGTAICNVLYTHNNNIELFVIKVFSDELFIDQKKLMYALNYVSENIDCDILNLSLGSCQCDDYYALHDCCDKIKEKGIIIVASFENGGAMSYPAAFDNVIGVTTGESCNKINDIEFFENSEINIATKGNRQKIVWIDQPYIVLAGNSIACAHASGIISCYLEKGIDRDDIMDVLRRDAKIIHKGTKNQDRHHSKIPFKICKAVLFPFNKEIHSIVRYQEMLDFEIVDVYDTKYSSHVGSDTNILQKGIEAKNFKIKNINKIELDSFDTIILGHVSEIKKLLNDKFDFNELVKKLLVARKNIFSFDDISEYSNDFSLDLWNKNVYMPVIKKNCIGIKPQGKLYRINKPIVCVCGTSSKQGKFSLQLQLRDYLSREGYSVGQLGTEPSSLLFGFDDCFHYGFNANIPFAGYEKVAYVNQLLHEIECKSVDIIISGAQSAMITQYEGFLWNYPLGQYEFLQGVQPDVVILCINPDDTVDYIRRTVKFVEGACDCNVLGLVVFPNKVNHISVTWGNTEKRIQNEEYQFISKKFSRELGLPVYRLDDKNDVCNLGNSIINYLSADCLANENG